MLTFALLLSLVLYSKIEHIARDTKLFSSTKLKMIYHHTMFIVFGRQYLILLDQEWAIKRPMIHCDTLTIMLVYKV